MILVFRVTSELESPVARVVLHNIRSEITYDVLRTFASIGQIDFIFIFYLNILQFGGRLAAGGWRLTADITKMSDMFRNHLVIGGV